MSHSLQCYVSEISTKCKLELHFSQRGLCHNISFYTRLKVYKNEKLQQFLEDDTHIIKMLFTLLSLLKKLPHNVEKIIFGVKQ